MSDHADKPRILVNALSLGEGGGRTYVVNLLREIERDGRGFDFTILAAEGRLSRAEVGSAALRTVRLPARASPMTSMARILYEELRLPSVASSYDLLYCVADVAPFRGRVPTVVALRNLNIYDRRYYDTLRLRALERLARTGLRAADRVVFPSEAAAKEISARLGLGPERSVVIPHGISPQVFRGNTSTVESDVPYLFAPCAPERHKNLSVAIRGLAVLDQEDVQLWIAGSSQTDPSHKAELQLLAHQLGVAGRVRFLGLVPYGKLPAYYRGAAALLFPSLLETFGHPLLEAMLLGTPILATDLPVFREVAEEAALYFRPDDPEDLAERVRELFREPEAVKRRVSRGIERARSYSWKQSIDRLCAVFEAVLSERGSSVSAG